jgi:general stress protein YciG
MAGTVVGGKLAAKINKAKYGDDFYARIGKIGGQNGHTGGFYVRRDIARSAGRLGGLKSRRGPKKV